MAHLKGPIASTPFFLEGVSKNTNLPSILACFVKEAKETRRVIHKTEPGKRRTEKCPGVMEQDREARDPARAGGWARAGAGDGEAGLGRARGVLAFAQAVGTESPISWESPAST